MNQRTIFSIVLPLATLMLAPLARAQEKPLRAGIIGCDTSHVIGFTDLINAADATGPRAQIEIVAAFPGGSDDIPTSRDRVAGFTEQLRGKGVKIVDSIDALLAEVDVVLLESVDGRKHLEQARQVFAAGKPVFIDKPLAANLADAQEIARLAAEHKVPWFSSSALRFARPAAALKAAQPKLGDITGCDVYAPCTLEPHHLDLAWYGVHGIETLYALMGPGCQSVTRVHTDGTDLTVGTWTGGRIGVFRGIRTGKADYGATLFGTMGIETAAGFEGYGPLVEEICKFFLTRKAPIDPAETLEMFAFMHAADQSKAAGGAPVVLEDVRNTSP